MGDQKPQTRQGPSTLNDNAVGPDSTTARRPGNNHETPAAGRQTATVTHDPDTWAALLHAGTKCFDRAMAQADYAGQMMVRFIETGDPWYRDEAERIAFSAMVWDLEARQLRRDRGTLVTA